MLLNCYFGFKNKYMHLERREGGKKKQTNKQTTNKKKPVQNVIARKLSS